MSFKTQLSQRSFISSSPFVFSKESSLSSPFLLFFFFPQFLALASRTQTACGFSRFQLQHQNPLHPLQSTILSTTPINKVSSQSLSICFQSNQGALHVGVRGTHFIFLSKTIIFDKTLVLPIRFHFSLLVRKPSKTFSLIGISLLELNFISYILI